MLPSSFSLFWQRMFANSLLKPQAKKPKLLKTPNPSNSYLVENRPLQQVSPSQLHIQKLWHKPLNFSKLLFPKFLQHMMRASLPSMLSHHNCRASAAQYSSLPQAPKALPDLQPTHQSVLPHSVLGWESSHTTMLQLKMLLLECIQPEESPSPTASQGLVPHEEMALPCTAQRTKLHQGILPIRTVVIAFE